MQVSSLVSMVKHISGEATQNLGLSDALENRVCDPLDAQLPDLESFFRQVAIPSRLLQLIHRSFLMREQKIMNFIGLPFQS